MHNVWTRQSTLRISISSSAFCISNGNCFKVDIAELGNDTWALNFDTGNKLARLNAL